VQIRGGPAAVTGDCLDFEMQKHPSLFKSPQERNLNGKTYPDGMTREPEDLLSLENEQDLWQRFCSHSPGTFL